MAKQSNYSDTRKYQNHLSFDGSPIPAGKVLVPFRVDQYSFRSDEYIPENLTTWHLGEFRFRVGFMAINEKSFADYMKAFWTEINEEAKMNREGRCIIGTKPDGSYKLCPHSRKCTGCPHKGQLPRHNPQRVELLSLDYAYEDETFDIADERQPSVEDQVLDSICPDASEAELLEALLKYLDMRNPRYALIVRLLLQGISIDNICIEIKLKSSRGRQEINNAHDAVCDYLKLQHHKKNRK